MMCTVFTQTGGLTPKVRGMTTTHAQRATAHIESVAAAREALRDLHAAPRTPSTASRAAMLHGQIGDGLKLAEVHATLAVAAAIEQLGLGL